MEIFKLFGRILVDDKEAQDSLSKTENKTKSVGDRMRGGLKTIATWGAALVGAATAAAAGLFALTNRVTANAQAIAVNASKVGVGVEAYQEMKYWADQNNVSSSAMDRAMGRLNQRVGRAAAGNEKYGKALKNLGIDMDAVKNGTLDTDDVMRQAIQSLMDMDNAQEQSAAASELFGTKLARDLMPALRDGSMSFDEAAEKAREMGKIMSEEQIEAAEDFQNSWNDIKDTMGAMTQQFALSVMPVFQRFLDWVIDYMPLIRSIFQATFDRVNEAIDWVVEKVQGFIDTLKSWYSENEETLSGIWGLFLQYLSLVIDYWTYVFNKAKDIVTDVFGYVRNFIMNVLGNIVDFWNEHGDQILETTMNIFNNIRNFITNVIQRISELWEEHGETIVENVRSAFTNVRNAIQNAIATVVEFVEEKLGEIQSFWEQHGEGIIETIRTTFQNVKENIQTTIETIVEYVRERLSEVQAFWDEHGDSILEFIQEAYEWIRENIITVLSEIVEFVGEKLSELKAFWDENAADILTAVENAFSIIATVIGAVMMGIWEVMKFIWPAVEYLIVSTWQLIQGAIDGALRFIMGLVDVFVGLFTGDFNRMWEGLKDMFFGALQFLWNAIQLYFIGRIIGIARSFVGLLRNLITNMWQGIRNIFTNSLNAVRNTVSNVLNGIRNIWNNILNGIRNFVSNIFNAIRNVVTNVLTGIRTTITARLNAIRSTFTNIFNAVRNVVSNALNRVRTTISNGMNNALRVVTNMAARFRRAGRNIIDSIISGITGSISKVRDAIGNVAETIRGFFPFSEPKEGPMRGITKIDFGGTIGEAIDNSEDEIRAKMNHMLLMPKVEPPDISDVGAQLLMSNDSKRVRQEQMINEQRKEEKVPKQPLNVYVQLGTKRDLRAMVENINEIQGDIIVGKRITGN